MKKIILGLFLIMGGLTVLAAQPAEPAPDPIPYHRPNVLLIVSDDQRIDTLGSMPTVVSEIVNKGMIFTKAMVPNSLCCPSRTAILTGNVSHNTGVWRNSYPYGGFLAFDDSSTLPVWLHDVGYQTGLFGKYLNQYVWPYIPPGWDSFVSFAGGFAYTNYDLNENGQLVHYGSAVTDYSTDVLKNKAVDFINTADPNKPIFVMFTPYAPHSPATPAARHSTLFSNLPPYRPASFNEADVSDKPQWVQNIPSMAEPEISVVDAFRKKQFKSLQAVDEGVADLLSALDQTGRLHNTIIIYMSDNGISWGEHRKRGKESIYWEDVRIPLVIRYDNLHAATSTDDHLVLNVDIAPTILQLITPTSTPQIIDGMSLKPLLLGQNVSWRDVFPVEHMISVDDGSGDGGEVIIPSYCGAISNRYAFAHYDTGEEELYDFDIDPTLDQLDNLAASSTYATVLSEMRQNAMDLCDPVPPGFSWNP